MIRRKCKICKAILKGRSDKQYCSSKCKNFYHTQLEKVNTIATDHIDKTLHRNRKTLLELMGKNSKQKKISRILLDRKKFNYKIMTGFYDNSQGKRYHIVYDFAWMEFSDGEILIIRRNING